MRSFTVFIPLFIATGCSLIVPAPGEFTYDLFDAGVRADGGPTPVDGALDAGPPRDAGAVDDSGAIDAATIDDAGVIDDAGLECPDGFADCDGNAANGCEAALDSLAHCGSCDVTCAWECTATGCNDPVAINVGEGHACAVRRDGTAACWGRNGSGQLGDRTTEDSPRAVVVQGVGNLIDIVAGQSHTCGLEAGGRVRCWGSNTHGETGDGMLADPRLLPVYVRDMTDAIALSAGEHFTCAVRLSGQVVCWGKALNGEMGDGTMDSRRVPGANVSDLDDTSAIDSVLYGTCVSRSTGGVWCWGLVLEEWAGFTSSSPMRFGFFGLVRDVAVAASHVCAITDDGAVACAGNNDSGQLGDGTTTWDSPYTVVEATGITGAVEVDVSDFRTCARLATGEVYCWGIGGSTGDGTTFERHEPVRVSGIDDAIQISSGNGSVTCALLATGEIRCWGWNGRGSLGDGTYMDALSPVTVLPPE